MNKNTKKKGKSASMENGRKRLDFDSQEQYEILLGGRCFVIKEQNEPAVVEVLEAMGYERPLEKDEEGKEEDRPIHDDAKFEWERSIPIVATMLGFFRRGDDRENVIEHLKEHLSLRMAYEIVKIWWELNYIDDFLAGNCRILIDPTILREMKKARTARMQESEKLIQLFEDETRKAIEEGAKKENQEKETLQAT